MTPTAFPRALSALVLVLLAPASILAQFGPEMSTGAEPPADDPAARQAKQAYEANLAAYKGEADFLVLPGLLADRKAQTIRLWGKATSLGHGDPIEFFLIPPDSGKDYEALAVAFVKPSDVHRALEFIGLRAGRPIDYAANQYWPKGPRIAATFHWLQPPPAADPTAKPADQRIRAEQLIINTETRKPLPATGLVFTGSYRIKPEEPGRPELYAADVVDPRSIASNFNCAVSVLDVPRQAVKGEVYGTQKLNPAYRFTPHQPLQIVLEPQYKNEPNRVIELSLHASANQFTLQGPDGKQLNEGPTLVHLLAAFNKLIEAGREPFVTVHVADTMTLGRVREFYKLLMSMDVENGIRIEAPPPGHLYYRAFFPDERWRQRSNRLGRPWELHLGAAGQPATLILPADEIDDNNGMGDLTFKVGSPEELARILSEKSDRFSRTVYIFAPARLEYGEMMSLVRPGLKTHPTMHVFDTR